MADKTSPILDTEEIIEAAKPFHGNLNQQKIGFDRDLAVARAQAKHTYEWGNERCEEHWKGGGTPYKKKRECYLCWQLLLEKKESGR
ncbi:MAG: hypothetical protein KAW00_04890 [Dehalococcoidia bacterium]|nr:hypothetical protein [Dehalococcoidia bacterium]